MAWRKGLVGRDGHQHFDRFFKLKKRMTAEAGQTFELKRIQTRSFDRGWSGQIGTSSLGGKPSSPLTKALNLLRFRDLNFGPSTLSGSLL